MRAISHLTRRLSESVRLVYVTIHELDTLFGDGELFRLFFRWYSSEAKLIRRQRIRLLTRLNRLTWAPRTIGATSRSFA